MATKVIEASKATKSRLQNQGNLGYQGSKGYQKYQGYKAISQKTRRNPGYHCIGKISNAINRLNYLFIILLHSLESNKSVHHNLESHFNRPKLQKGGKIVNSWTLNYNIFLSNAFNSINAQRETLCSEGR